MIPREQFRELLVMLLDKSKDNLVNWIEEVTGPMGAGSRWFKVVISECVVRIGMGSPATDPDYYRVQIWNHYGRVVAEWTAIEGDPESEMLELLRSLYEEAERSVTGWDAVLTNLKAELSKNGVVGDTPEPSF